MTTAYTSLLGLALPVPGELTGTWGSVVNNSITSLLDTAIAGVATASVTSGDWTLSDIDGASSDARAAIIRPTGSPGVGVSRNIIAPSQSKAYIIQNESNGPVVIKGSATTGVTIAAGKTTLVAWNGTDFIEIVPSLSTTATAANGLNSATTTVAVSSATAPTTGQVLTATSGSAATWQTPTSSGGSVTSVAATVPSFLSVSGSPITTSGTLAISYSGTALPVLNGGTGVTTSTGSGSIVLSTSPTLVTPILGTPTSGTLTSCTGLPLTTGVTGTLSVANGGTGTTTPSLVPGTNVTITGTWPNQTINASGGGGGSVTSVSGTGSVNGITLSGTVTSTGSLTLGGTLSNVSLSSQVTGTLPVANGGNGTASPSISSGTGISVSGSWPNYTITNTASSLTGQTTGSSGSPLQTTVLGVNSYPGSANFNTVLGASAGSSSMAGLHNTLVGYATGAALTGAGVGNLNTFCGSAAGTQVTSGTGNTAVGYGGLSGLTTGNYNVAIGYAAAPSSVSVSNEVTITNNSVIARFQGAASSWTFPSDVRDKTNIADLSVGLAFVNQLQPRTFEWNLRKSEVDKGKKVSGFIAQEVLAVMESENAMYTQLVSAANEEQYTMAQTNLIPILVNAIKELSVRVAALEASNG